jgi:glycosyltransferase involved in cell wall biosynthesis
MMQPDGSEACAISVVIPTRDRPQFLEECLRSVASSIRPFDEIIVADSASKDPRVRDIAHAFGAKYVRCDEPGASRARNAGWRTATRTLVAFIDDDVHVEPHWADSIASCFARFRDAAFVSGRVGTPEGTPTESAPFLVDPDAVTIDPDFAGDPGHSANLTVRKSALERIGGFDEVLGAGGPFRAAEDKDLFDRLLASGFTGRYEPSAAVEHRAWRDRPNALSLSWGYGFGTGARIAKLLRTDRPRAKRVAKENLWNWGLLSVIHAIKAMRKWRALVNTVRTAGMIAGFCTGAVRRVEDGHFRARSTSLRGTHLR